MADIDGIRLLLEQEGPYAFKVSFEGAALEALHTDEAQPLGSGAGPGPADLLLAGLANCLCACNKFNYAACACTGGRWQCSCGGK